MSQATIQTLAYGIQFFLAGCGNLKVIPGWRPGAELNETAHWPAGLPNEEAIPLSAQPQPGSETGPHAAAEDAKEMQFRSRRSIKRRIKRISWPHRNIRKDLP
jgi:hypothetical protein